MGRVGVSREGANRVGKGSFTLRGTLGAQPGFVLSSRPPGPPSCPGPGHVREDSRLHFSMYPPHPGPRETLRQTPHAPPLWHPPWWGVANTLQWPWALLGHYLVLDKTLRPFTVDSDELESLPENPRADFRPRGQPITLHQVFGNGKGLTRHTLPRVRDPAFLTQKTARNESLEPATLGCGGLPQRDTTTLCRPLPDPREPPLALENLPQPRDIVWGGHS